jgi:hypothetical protein
MAKIDRRDYLKKMGAGVGVLAGTKLDLVAPGSKHKQKRTKKSSLIKHPGTQGILVWPITHTPPSLNPFVTAIFSGLAGFSYDKHSGEGIVGFHPGNGDHKLDIKIYRKPGCEAKFMNCHQEFPPTLPRNIETMKLSVVGNSGRSPDYFQTVDDPFDRKTGHDHDFRWLPDLDSADFYPEGYAKNKHFTAMLRVTSGTFYTRVKTNSTFKLVNADNNLELRSFGHVAMYMALAIDVGGNDYVALEVNNETPIKLCPESGVTYQIVFANICSNNGAPCRRVLDSDDETQRNDFHFSRKVLKLPSDRIKYALRIDEQAMVGAKSDFCPDEIARNTDEAPCMGSGYGQDNV